MKHLSDAEFVDLLEQDDAGGARLPADRLRHVESCEACRTQAADLRAALAEASGDQVPAPSPLYWEYFSVRVADAIRGERPAAAPSPPPASWLRRPLAQWATAASMAVLVMMTVVWRATLHAPTPAAGAPAAIAPVSPPAVDVPRTDLASVGDDIDADEAWAVVRTAAEGLGWEDAHAAGISPRPGSAEGIALELTAEERAELARLIDGELKRRGA